MESVDRLAAYLAGELPLDDAERVRASLVADPEFARQLAALERADAALAGLAPTAEPDGLAARLEAQLAPVISAQVSQGDELAARRRARRPARRWVPAAAAAAVLAVAGTGVLLIGGEGPAEDTADTIAMERAGEPGDALRSDADAPRVAVVDEDRELDAELADALLDDPALLAVTELALDASAGEQLAAQVRDELGGPEAAAMAATPETEFDPAGDALPDDFADAPDDVAENDVTEDPRQAVARCLEVVLTPDPAAIPAYAELAWFDDEAVVVLGLVTPDAPGIAYTRSEIWVLSRDDCALRRFAQHD